MIQYNILNVKLSNSQLNKLKSALKNETEVTLYLSLNLIGSFDDDINFPHKLLTYTQVSKILKAFVNGSSANIKFPKPQLSNIVQLGRFASNFADTFFSPHKMTKNINNIIKTSDNIIKTATDSKNILKVLKNASDKVFETGITQTNNEIKILKK